MAKKVYTIEIVRYRWGHDASVRTASGTLDELIKYFNYTLMVGESWQHEKGNKKINRNPRTIASLITNLNNAEDNAAKNGYSNTSYRLAS